MEILFICSYDCEGIANHIEIADRLIRVNFIIVTRRKNCVCKSAL